MRNISWHTCIATTLKTNIIEKIILYYTKVLYKGLCLYKQLVPHHFNLHPSSNVVPTVIIVPSGVLRSGRLLK